MKLRMLETRRGSEDGFRVREYLQGEEYDLADGLARAFLARGYAKEVASDESPVSRQETRD